jgi:hypothetical protein
LLVAPNRQDRDGRSEAKKLEKCSDVTAGAHPNTVIPPRLCCVALPQTYITANAPWLPRLGIARLEE